MSFVTVAARSISTSVTVAMLACTPSQAAVDFLSLYGCQPVRIERAGEIATWQTKTKLRAITPFAIERSDASAWLYVQGGGSPNQGSVSRAEFDTMKRYFIQAFQAFPRAAAIDDGAQLTITFEEPAPRAGAKEPLAVASRLTLISGCIIPMVLQREGGGDASDLIVLLNQVKVGD